MFCTNMEADKKEGSTRKKKKKNEKIKKLGRERKIKLSNINIQEILLMFLFPEFYAWNTFETRK